MLASKLHKAIFQQDLKLFNELLIVEIHRKRENLELRNEFGHTPLHTAANGQDSIFTQTLLQNGANIHAITPLKETALHIAVRAQSVENVNLLLQQPSLDVNAQTIKCHGSPIACSTALHYVFYNEHSLNEPIICAFLQSERINYDYASGSSDTPFTLAIKHPQIHELSYKTFCALAEKSQIKKIHINGMNALLFAVKNPSMPCHYFMFLLNLLGTDEDWITEHINKQDMSHNTALTFAMQRNWPDVAQDLLAMGANPEATYCEYKNVKNKIRSYLKDGDTVAHYAIRTKNDSLLSYCLKKAPALVNIPNKQGYTPAALVLENGSQHMAQLLGMLGDPILESVPIPTPLMRTRPSMHLSVLARNRGLDNHTDFFNSEVTNTLHRCQ